MHGCLSIARCARQDAGLYGNQDSCRYERVGFKGGNKPSLPQLRAFPPSLLISLSPLSLRGCLDWGLRRCYRIVHE
jgi:hypothetical protein